MNKLDSIKKKIKYRSNYRGTKELDIILSNFVNKILDKLTEADLVELSKLLDFDDEVIYKFYQNNIAEDGIENNKMAKLLLKYKND